MTTKPDNLKPVSKVHAKWGFGDAPLKPNHLELSISAIEELLAILDRLPDETSYDLDSISHVKGMFSRVVKQDQWDWSTVWRLLGRPSRQPCQNIASGLTAFRKAIKDNDFDQAMFLRDKLRESEIERYLQSFLSGPQPLRSTGSAPGYIYILSSRDRPALLKIGFTTRSIEERVKEINAATGVIYPYGIRAVWEVDDSSQVERDIHLALSGYRVRSDREFFEIDYREATRLINRYLRDRRRAQGVPAE